MTRRCICSSSQQHYKRCLEDYIADISHWMSANRLKLNMDKNDRLQTSIVTAGRHSSRTEVGGSRLLLLSTQCACLESTSSLFSVSITVSKVAAQCGLNTLREHRNVNPPDATVSGPRVVSVNQLIAWNVIFFCVFLCFVICLLFAALRCE